MLTLALAALLSADDPPPPVPDPSPPPLVPALRPQGEVPPLLAPDDGTRRPLPNDPSDPDVEAEQQRPATEPDNGDFSGSRAAITGGVAAGAGGLVVAGGLLAAYNVKGGTGIIFGILSLPAALFIGTGAAFAAHRAVGGQGGWGAHLAGGAVGGGVALLGTLLYVTSLNGRDPGVTAEACLVIGAGALFGLGTALFAELSHSRTVGEHHGRVAIVPTKGGAMAALGFGF